MVRLKGRVWLRDKALSCRFRWWAQGWTVGLTAPAQAWRPDEVMAVSISWCWASDDLSASLLSSFKDW